MIEESVIENERKGNFIRVYPNDQHVHLYRNFFEEERRSDNVLHSYIFNKKYMNMAVDSGANTVGTINYDQLCKKNKNSRAGLNALIANQTASASKTQTSRMKIVDQFSADAVNKGACSSTKHSGLDNWPQQDRF